MMYTCQVFDHPLGACRSSSSIDTMLYNPGRWAQSEQAAVPSYSAPIIGLKREK